MKETMLLCLPAPVGWIALTPDGLRHAQIAAHEVLGVFPDETRPGVPATAPALLTAEDAAAQLSVDVSWLLRQAREGRVDHVRIGRLVRFDPATIIEQSMRRRAGP